MYDKYIDNSYSTIYDANYSYPNTRVTSALMLTKWHTIYFLTSVCDHDLHLVSTDAKQMQMTNVYS